MEKLLGANPFVNLKEHHAILLTGEKGIGKSVFAKAHICEEWAKFNSTSSFPEENDKRLGELQNLEGVHLLTEQEGIISVNQIADLRDDLALSSLVPRRFVLVDGADSMTIQAQNALLKVLEEPPEGLSFILIYHGTRPLLPTIRSRCLLVRIPALSQEQIGSVLEEHGFEYSSEIIEHARGSAGKALTLAENRGEMNSILEALDTAPNFSWEKIEELSKETLVKDYFWDILRKKLAEWSRNLRPDDLGILSSLLLLRVKRSLEGKPLLWLFLSMVERGYRV